MDEEPGRLQSMGSQRIRHNWATSLSLFIFLHWRRKWYPTPVFLPGESQGQGRLAGFRLWGRTESDMTEATLQQQQQHTYEIAYFVPKVSSHWYFHLLAQFHSNYILDPCLIHLHGGYYFMFGHWSPYDWIHDGYSVINSLTTWTFADCQLSAHLLVQFSSVA